MEICVYCGVPPEPGDLVERVIEVGCVGADGHAYNVDGIAHAWCHAMQVAEWMGGRGLPTSASRPDGSACQGSVRGPSGPDIGSMLRRVTPA